MSVDRRHSLGVIASALAGIVTAPSALSAALRPVLFGNDDIITMKGVKPDYVQA